ncbi:hypothetical protein DFH06DRAFT_1296104 [Mycena polygramma]|nr:hypothetical protein DFH06DRAFT_1296104 [Mycena polygramma]
MASPTEMTAFVVALVALVIAVLQVLQQYLGTSAIRNKVGPAAIGAWAKHNRHPWSWANWAFKAEYRQLTLTWKDVYRCLDEQEDEDLAILKKFAGKYAGSIGWTVGSSAQGRRIVRSQLSLRRRGEASTETQSRVDINSLSWAERRVFREFQKLQVRRKAARSPCKATYMNMVGDLGVANPSDLLEASGNSDDQASTVDSLVLSSFTAPSYVGAETIPSSMDHPITGMYMSDLVALMAVLDAEIKGYDVTKPTIHMTSQHCSITSQEDSGIGYITRYTSTPNHVHHVQTCSPSQVRILIETARGSLHIGDVWLVMRDWGYNSVNALFGIIVKAIKRIGISGGSPQSSCRSRKEIKMFDGRGAGVNRRPILFPHSLMGRWPQDDRRLASQTAYKLINDGVGFIEAPYNLPSKLKDANVITGDRYKLASNWGAEHGGSRGWSMSSLAEFTKMVNRVQGGTEIRIADTGV